ncbi:MAG: hypothetical protein JWO86_2805 [Myxococcaceae bacterium]|nr:hypothetical protein [Myxococcaceae bacterium]
MKAPALAFAALALLAALATACSRAAPDATPEGAVRLFVEKMETGAEDPRAMRDAYGLLGPHARSNLKERADRASKGQGRRYEPFEMLAEGRFGLKFRPKTMNAKIDGDDAFVEVRGDGPEERATVHCTRESLAWRVEPELPDVQAPQRRADGGT